MILPLTAIPNRKANILLATNLHSEKKKDDRKKGEGGREGRKERERKRKEGREGGERGKRGKERKGKKREKYLVAKSV